MYIHVCIMYNINIYTLYTSQGYYLNFLDIHKLFTVKEPLSPQKERVCAGKCSNTQNEEIHSNDYDGGFLRK